MGTETENPFHFREFDLKSVNVFRNDYPITGTPLLTDDNKNIYMNSIEALAFRSHGHGVPVDECSKNNVLVFNLTSTQQASHDYLYRELTKGVISIELRFSKDSTNDLELFFWAKISTIDIYSARKIHKKIFFKSQTDKQSVFEIGGR